LLKVRVLKLLEGPTASKGITAKSPVPDAGVAEAMEMVTLQVS